MRRSTAFLAAFVVLAVLALGTRHDGGSELRTR